MKYSVEDSRDWLQKCEQYLLDSLQLVRAAKVLVGYPNPTQEMAFAIRLISKAASVAAGVVADADASDVEVKSFSDPVDAVFLRRRKR
jgi:hypothetical protein